MNVYVLISQGDYIDDGFTVEEALNNKGVKYYSMSDAIDILPKLNINPKIATHIENYFIKYGKKEIKF